MEDIVFELIDDHVCSADMYTYSGSIWMIFTDEKKWVIELTKEGTLWYNYYFFKSLFKYVSMDDIEYQDYITKWVENTLQNGVRCTQRQDYLQKWPIENTIQNGVRYTSDSKYGFNLNIENTIQNGVKHTISEINQDILWVEKTIQDGVKYTQVNWGVEENRVEDTLENGIRHTNLEMNHQPMTVLRVIEDGIRTTYPEYNDMSERIEKVVKETELHKGTRPASTEHTIQNGIKQTSKRKLTINPNTVPDIIQDVVENGFKEIKKEPSQRTWMSQQVIENGVKKTYPDKIPHEYDWSDQFTEEIDDIIENGVKHTQGSIFDNPTAVKDTIQNGVKKTKPMDEWVNTKRIIEKTIQEGIKQTKTPGKDGDIVSVTEFMKEHNSNNVPKMIDEIIENGIKKTGGGVLFDESKIDTVICEGIKEVKELPDKSGELRGYGDYYRRQKDMAKPHTLYVKDVIDNGIKKTISGHPDKKEFVEKVVLEYGVKETWGYDKQPQIRIDNVIENGITLE